MKTAEEFLNESAFDAIETFCSDVQRVVTVEDANKYASLVTEEKDRRIRELSDELVKCEKTFGLIWQIFGTLENAHCDDLRHLVDDIDIDIPLIQARIKDTLNPPKP